jgi:hypothetical protein
MVLQYHPPPTAPPPYPYHRHLVGGSTSAPPPYPYPTPPPYGYSPYSYPPPIFSGSTGGHAPSIYSYPPPPVCSYPVPQPIHYRSGDNSSGGENTSRTTQTLTRMKKRIDWTRSDEENCVVLNFIILLSIF